MPARAQIVSQAALPNHTVDAENKIKELEKNRRLSARVIPLQVGFLVVLAIVLWIVRKFFDLPRWVTAIVLGLPVFTLLGDFHNYFYCGRKLATLRRDGTD